MDRGGWGAADGACKHVSSTSTIAVSFSAAAVVVVVVVDDDDDVAVVVVVVVVVPGASDALFVLL